MAGRKPAEEAVTMIAIAAGSPGWLTAKQACTALGLSPALVRLWESRYGWPCPRRTGNGQRRFSAADLDEIRRVLAQVRAGRAIGSLLVDGRPHLPEPAPRPRLDQQVVAAIPQPARAPARALRRDLVDALAQRDEGTALAAVARAPRDCAPEDRAWAAWLPALTLLAAWEAQGQRLPGAARLRAAVAAQARELLAQRRPLAAELGVVAACPELAVIAAAALTLAGHRARPLTEGAITGPYVTVGERGAPAMALGDRRHRGHAGLLGGAGLAELAGREPGWWSGADRVG